MHHLARRLRLGILPLVLLAAPLRAAEPLRWKFEPGAVNRYRLSQDMVVAMDLGPGGQVEQHATNTLDMTWTVADVQADGSAVVKLRFDRVQLRVQSPGVDEVNVDTQATDEPQGFAAMISPLLREMSRTEITATMSPRGKIADVQVPEQLLQAIAAGPGAQLLGDLATQDGVARTVASASFELPETLEPGAEWTSTVEVANPVLGKNTIRTTYRYVGPRQVDGVEYEAFAPTIEIGFANGPAAVEISNQQTSGEALFNRAAGRLESTHVEHAMDLKLTADGRTIAQSIKQKATMERLPEETE